MTTLREAVQLEGFWLCAIVAAWLAWACIRRVRRCAWKCLWILLAASAVLVATESVRIKLDGDDVVIARTARSFAQAGLRQSTGVWNGILVLDKRPPMAAFLGSWVCRLGGLPLPSCVAIANAFLVGPLFLGGLYWLLLRTGSRRTAALALLAAAALPLAGYVFTGGGLEPAYLLGLVLAAGFIMDGDENGALAAGAWTALSRYEGVLAAAVIVALVLARRWRMGAGEPRFHLLRGARALGAGLLLALASSHTLATVVLGGQDYAARYGKAQTGAGASMDMLRPSHAGFNLLHQAQFLFEPTRGLPNAPLLALAGAGALALLTFRRRVWPAVFLAPFLVTSLCLLASYWGDATDAVIWRLMLPLLVALLVLVVHALQVLHRPVLTGFVLGSVLLWALAEKWDKPYLRDTRQFNNVTALAQTDWTGRQYDLLKAYSQGGGGEAPRPVVLVTTAADWPDVCGLAVLSPEDIPGQRLLLRKRQREGVRYFAVVVYWKKPPPPGAEVLDSKSFADGTTFRLVAMRFD